MSVGIFAFVQVSMMDGLAGVEKPTCYCAHKLAKSSQH